MFNDENEDTTGSYQSRPAKSLQGVPGSLLFALKPIKGHETHANNDIELQELNTKLNTLEVTSVQYPTTHERASIIHALRRDSLGSVPRDSQQEDEDLEEYFEAPVAQEYPSDTGELQSMYVPGLIPDNTQPIEVFMSPNTKPLLPNGVALDFSTLRGCGLAWEMCGPLKEVPDIERDDIDETVVLLHILNDELEQKEVDTTKTMSLLQTFTSWFKGKKQDEVDLEDLERYTWSKHLHRMTTVHREHFLDLEDYARLFSAHNLECFN